MRDEGWQPKRRKAGLLLHPTSLPGGYGIGELGSEALDFVRFLSDAGQRLWQVLPFCPPGKGNSPYSSSSAFAGNPLLISTEGMIQNGLLQSEVPKSSIGPINYPKVASSKTKLLREAYARAALGRDFGEFREQNRFWLEDYTLFAALKEKFGGVPWNQWPARLSHREPRALAEARRDLSQEILFHQFAQYLFFRDWEAVKSAANEADVEVLGDIPIFVSHDSADVWANQGLFHLDGAGEPTVVAGVPPDYFSETGQLWGNPLYDWGRMREGGYRWWIERMRQSLTLYDLVRIDHFRGMQAYWEVPADATTATEGHWVEGPGSELFEALRNALGELPIVAEDLGEITPEVEALRDGLGLPGMKVLQFAFSDPDNPHLPHNYAGEDWVTYTGTHDNDTTLGWWNCLPVDERAFVRRYLGCEYISVWDFVRLAYSSIAERAIVPMQDVLGLGSEARMNRPGEELGNWEWRMSGDALTSELAGRLRSLAETYGR